MSDFREDLLTVILDCGYGDLYLLGDCQYDIEEIVEDCIHTYGNLEINNLVRIMFDMGLSDIEAAINDRICQLEYRKKEEELSDEDKAELEVLSTLDPYSDIRSFHNYVDTHIWFDNKDNVFAYHAYMQDALDNFCEMTGFEITD